MKKIYIVTAGEYSGYHIKRVFSTRKLADKYTKTFIERDNFEVEYCNVEEFDVDEPVDYKNLIVEFCYENINNKYCECKGSQFFNSSGFVIRKL